MQNKQKRSVRAYVETRSGSFVPATAWICSHGNNPPTVADIDLTPLPDGFRTALVKERSRLHPETPWGEALAIALGNVWAKSTNRQRAEAQDAIAGIILEALRRGEPDSAFGGYEMGYLSVPLGGSSIDFYQFITDDSEHDREWSNDSSGILRGIWDAGGINVAEGMSVVVENIVNS